ncbi:hypothetical protein RI367_002315 [Sorochytrium milnesiophthora]
MTFDLYPLYEYEPALPTEGTGGSAVGRTAASESGVRRSFSASSAASAHRTQRDRPTSYISACDIFGSSLYVGTSDGQVRLYQLASATDAAQRKCEMLAQIGTPAQKVIESITVLPTTNVIAVLTDTSVFFLSADLRPTSIAPVRAVTAICRDVHATSQAALPVMQRLALKSSAADVLADKLAIAKRRVIQCLEVHKSMSSGELQLVVEKDVAHSDGAIAMARSGDTICLADTQQYRMLHISSNRVAPLFPYHSSTGGSAMPSAVAASPILGGGSPPSSNQSGKSARPLSFSGGLPFLPQLQQTPSSSFQNFIRPHIAVVGEGEFLVTTGATGQTSLGMFIGLSGDPVRGTIQWNSYPRSVEIQFPFVVSLVKNESVVTLFVHNLLTQQLVQELALPFDALRVHSVALGTELSTSDPLGTARSPFQLLVRDRTALVALCTTSVEEQLAKLLEQGKVDEATALAEATYKKDGRRELHPQLRTVYVRSAYDMLQNLSLDSALPLFQQTKVSPAALVSLYNPHLCGDAKTPLDDVPVSDRPPASLGSFAHIVALLIHRHYAGNPSVHVEVAETYRRRALHGLLDFLCKYLLWARKQRMSTKLDLDMVILHLYADMDAPQLLDWMQTVLQTADGDRTQAAEAVLQTFGRHNAIFQVYRRQGRISDAIALAKRLIEREISDPAFPGSQAFYELLAQVDSIRDHWDDLMWYLKTDPPRAVQLLHVRAKELQDVDVVELLRSQTNNNTLKLYLLYMIDQVQTKDSALHTALATVYLTEFTDQAGNQLTRLAELYETAIKSGPLAYVDFLKQGLKRYPGQREDIKRRLQLHEFVARSQCVDAAALIDTLQGDPSLVLPERMGQLDHALHLAVQELHDFAGAETICTEQPASSKARFTQFLQLFIDMPDRGQYVHSFSVVLRRNLQYFNLDELLRLLPDEIELSLISSLLAPTARRLRHLSLAASIHTALARQQNMDTSVSKLQQEAKVLPVVIAEHPYVSTFCAACRRPIVRNEFVRDAAGQVRHPACAVRQSIAQPSTAVGRH